MEIESFETIHMFWQEGDPGNSIQHKLQRIINKYLHQVDPEKTNQKTKKYSLHVTDEDGAFMGGAVILVYNDWVEIVLLALINEMRGLGLGKGMLDMIEQKAREFDCKRIRTETCEINVGFYQKCGYKMGEKLEDYPPGLNYFWLHKDLD
jgi:N-acetylglutamate synthase-like GNAT family acetyltransferase